MKYNRFALVLVLLLGVFGPSAFAQAASPMTEKELVKLIQDWPSVGQWFEARGKSLDSAASGQSLAALFVGSDFAAFLKGKGWTVERFSYVSGTTFSLMAYLAFERQNPEVIKQFDDAIAQVRSDSSMSEAEKAAMIKTFEDTKKSLLSMPAQANYSEAELKLVRARFDALMGLVDQ